MNMRTLIVSVLITKFKAVLVDGNLILFRVECIDNDLSLSRSSTNLAQAAPPSFLQHNNLSTCTVLTTSPVRIFLSATWSCKGWIPLEGTLLCLALFLWLYLLYSG